MMIPSNAIETPEKPRLSLKNTSFDYIQEPHSYKKQNNTTPKKNEDRAYKIGFLRSSLKNIQPDFNEERDKIDVKYFPEFLPSERFFFLISHGKNDIKIGYGKEIIHITKWKLIERITNDYEQSNELFRTVLYCYRSLFDDRELFTFLLKRFKTPLPVGLSPYERKVFLDNIVSKIQIKILIFLKEWFKLYNHCLHHDPHLEPMFFEMLYLMFTHPDSGKWVNIPISQLLSDLEKLSSEPPPKVIHAALKISSLPEVFVPIKQIMDYSHHLAKQLCIFDVDNLKNIHIGEFFDKNWTKPEKLVKAPALTYIADMSTRLSRLTSYLILMNKKNKLRVMLYNYLIETCDQLVRLKNFNSAFSIYLGLQSPAIQRLKELLEPNIDRDHKEILQNLRTIFSANNNNENLRNKQSEATTPAVLYLGSYLGEIFYLEELPSYLNQEKTLINYNKFNKITQRIHRIMSFRESYGFHRVDNILHFIKGIPAISEDQIYDLSYQILKN